MPSTVDKKHRTGSNPDPISNYANRVNQQNFWIWWEKDSLKAGSGDWSPYVRVRLEKAVGPCSVKAQRGICTEDYGIKWAPHLLGIHTAIQGLL